MNTIYNLSNAFIRTPLYSFKEYQLIPKETDQLDVFIGTLWENKIFKEALLLASSELYLEWERSNSDKNYLKTKKEKVHLSILKYYIRITTRSTPFGLFSSYSHFEIEEDTAVGNTEPDLNSLERFTTFDLAFLYNLSRHLNNNPIVRAILKYTVNNSIYKIGDSYRYVEVLLNKDKREHILTSLESDEVLELIFSNCETQKTIPELSNLLVNHVEDVTYDQAFDYINNLIDAQVLVSHLDICLNQKSPLDQILLFLEENKTTIEKHSELNALFQNLQHLKSKLNELDCTIGNDFEKYTEIYTLVNELNISYSKNNIINVNLRKNTNNTFINKQDIHKIKKAIKAMSLFSDELTAINEDSNLVKFKNAFYKRYEEKEIPLTIALDNEVGIGYIQTNNENNDFSSLLNDIQFENKPPHIETIKYNNRTHLFWSTLFYDALRNKTHEINLKNVDLSDFTEKLHKLSRTFAVIVSKTQDKIVIDHVGESSSLNLIARFSNADAKLNDLINEAVKTEEVSDDIICAELLHIPNDRDGNILLRKIDRKYELSLLTKTSTDAEAISIQDIFVSIKKNKVVLWSRKWNKQIKIFNSTAHNYHYNSLPIYQLLCDLQYQDILGALSLNFGFTNTNTFQFIPRIVYGEDIVLSAASWKLKYDDLKFCHDETTGTINVQKFAAFREIHAIPKHIYVFEDDNKLLIDTENKILLGLLFESAKKYKTIKIKECLYNIETDHADNEVIIPFVNTKHKENHYISKRTEPIKSKFIPAEEWLYYKIYTGVKTANKILVDVIQPLVAVLKEKGLIKKWFFIRYRDTDFHLRIRFAFDENIDGSIQEIMTLFNESLKFYVENHMIWKVELATYDKELERYQGKVIELSEKIFHYDSELVLQLIDQTRASENKDLLWILTFKCIDGYFNLFHFNNEEKHAITESLYNTFQQEFEADKNVRKQVNLKYRNYLPMLKDVFSSKSEEYAPYVAIIEDTMSKIATNCWEMNRLHKTQCMNLIDSFIHMHINRITKSNPRTHELVIYGILEKYYRMKLAQIKHQKVASL